MEQHIDLEEREEEREKEREKEKEKEKEIEQYLSQLNDTQKKAYHIAKAHLKTSFNIFKSIGYLDWKKQKN